VSPNRILAIDVGAGTQDILLWEAGQPMENNVKLVLQGHHEGYKMYGGEVPRLTGAGIANGPDNESDAFTLWVYKDHLQLDRYVIPAGGRTMKPVEGPVTVWTCEGSFSEYQRPELPAASPKPTGVPAGAAAGAPSQ